MAIVTEAKPTSTRLMSIDALRGFDMFWIIGADALVSALNRMSQTAPTRFLATQLDHVEWSGFHFYDLIFPLFVFIVGVSSVFSLSKTIEREGRTAALQRVFRRGILLFILKPRALAASAVVLLAGYWALMTFVPIRDIQLTRSNIARVAEQAGDL